VRDWQKLATDVTKRANGGDTVRRFVTLAILVIVAGAPLATRQATVDVRVIDRPEVKAALEAARQGEPRVLEDQAELSDIAAPLMKEARRGAAIREKFAALGLSNVRTDAAGNVLGDRAGRSLHPHLVLAAHLDTVFPEGTNVKVSREGTTMKGPGIADDARGLAVLLGVMRALDAGKVKTEGTITFVANVGEEGLGDLRGMKQIFDQTLKGTVDAFVSIDGDGLDVTNIGVGSHRYRVTFKGPGGHSYGDFGLANPIHALGRVIAQVAEFKVPSDPKTTFNVGRVSGGTSVNSIPYEASMEMDMRSVDPRALDVVDAAFHKAIDRALAEENARWNDHGRLAVAVDLVGDRPAGRTPDDSPIVRTAVAVTRALGAPADLGAGSTDANYPMSLRIPAITIGGGGSARGAHSLAESFDSSGSWQGTQRALLLAVALTTGGR
jgi:acetylornithine deacetylase/succinyl-diaminopimelate desuccinylase-like protein